MNECKEEEVKPVLGRTYRLKERGTYFLATRGPDSNKVYLHSLNDGNIWSSNGGFDGDARKFEEVELCYKVVN